MEKIVREASENGPTILTIDEIDSFISKRTDGNQSEAAKQVKNLLLELISGIRSVGNVFIIGTTNHPEDLDSAFLDRCTLMVKMNLPDSIEKFHFLNNHLQKKKIEHKITYQEFLTINTNKFSYRNMESLLDKAIAIAMKETRKHTHFRVVEDGDTSDILVGCSCSDEDCDRLQMEMEDIPRENIRLCTLLMSHIRMSNVTVTTSQEELNIMDYFEKHGEAPTKDQLKEMMIPTAPVVVKSHNIWEVVAFGLPFLVLIAIVLVMVLKAQGRI